jgi:transposase
VQQAFAEYAAQVLDETPAATEAVGIDEIRRGKPVWRQNRVFEVNRAMPLCGSAG